MAKLGYSVLFLLVVASAGELVWCPALVAQVEEKPAATTNQVAERVQREGELHRQFVRSGRVGELIEKFAYLAIIGLLLLCGMGLPLPEEVPILTSAILSQAGHLRPWWALGACLIGVMVGDSAMFLLGRHWGPHVLEHRLAKYLLTVDRRQRIEHYFQRYGARTVFGARFLPGIRAPLFLTAGSMRVSFGVFFSMNGTAALLSIPTSFWLAFFFTDQLERLLQLRNTIQYWALAFVLAGLAIWFAFRRYRARKSVSTSKR